MVRFVFNLRPRDHVDRQHLKSLSWLTINDRVGYFQLIHVFKIRKGLAPNYLSEGFTQVSEVHGHLTRSSRYDFHIPGNMASTLMQTSFAFTAAKLWNDLPYDIKQIDSETVFKRKLKLHFLNAY